MVCVDSVSGCVGCFDSPTKGKDCYLFRQLSLDTTYLLYFWVVSHLSICLGTSLFPSIKEGLNSFVVHTYKIS